MSDLELELRRRKQIAKNINFGMLYGTGVGRSYNQQKDFKVGDHVYMTGPSRAYGVITKVFDARALVAWDNSWDNQVLGNGPFWHDSLEKESDLERFTREVSDELPAD